MKRLLSIVGVIAFLAITATARAEENQNKEGIRDAGPKTIVLVSEVVDAEKPTGELAQFVEFFTAQTKLTDIAIRDNTLFIARSDITANHKIDLASDCPSNSQFKVPADLATDTTVHSILIAITKYRHPGQEKHDGRITIIGDGTREQRIDITLMEPTLNKIGFVPR